MSAPALLAYGMQIDVPLGYEAAVALTREALADRGFGVQTEIDVRATMQKKLGVEFRPYVILGACNPPIAHRALTEELPIGLLLPCNVIVYAGDVPGTSVVAALDPVVLLGLTGRDDMTPMATQVRALLEQALEQVSHRARAPQPPSKGS
jgi:uncharacterized protein (DUF302 family)